jgi:hypothetical protein
LQIGFGYAFGILLAITICAGTSGGHFNPCVTISLVVFRGFPPLKAVRYEALVQFGAHIQSDASRQIYRCANFWSIHCLFAGLYSIQGPDQSKRKENAPLDIGLHIPKLVDEGLAAKGLLDSIQFTPNGTGGILALYTQPGANLARTLLNEFVSVSPNSPPHMIVVDLSLFPMQDTVIGLAIWGCIDPTNFLVPPAAGPWVISFA